MGAQHTNGGPVGDKPWLMKPGERRIGRVRGTPNKHTRLLKDATLLAAELEGDVGLQTKDVKKMYAETDPEAAKRGGLVGYLRWLARTEPTAFVSLLNKIIPTQIKIDGFTQTVYESVEEVQDDLAKQGLTLEALRPLLLDGRRMTDGSYGVAPNGGDE